MDIDTRKSHPQLFEAKLILINNVFANSLFYRRHWTGLSVMSNAPQDGFIAKLYFSFSQNKSISSRRLTSTLKYEL